MHAHKHIGLISVLCLSLGVGSGLVGCDNSNNSDSAKNNVSQDASNKSLPTKPKLDKSSKAQTPNPSYTIELAPNPLPAGDAQATLKQPKASINLVNYEIQPIKTFTGTLAINAPNFAKPQILTIPLTQFEPAIAKNGRGQLAINRSLKNAGSLEKITDIKTTSIKIISGEMTLENGKHISLPALPEAESSK